GRTARQGRVAATEITTATRVIPRPTAPHVTPAAASPRPVTEPPPRRTWRSPATPSTTDATPAHPASTANAPATTGPQPPDAPSPPRQLTTRATRIEAIPATRLAEAGPLLVGGAGTIATPNGVPGTGSTASGGGRPGPGGGPP